MSLLSRLHCCSLSALRQTIHPSIHSPFAIRIFVPHNYYNEKLGFSIQFSISVVFASYLWNISVVPLFAVWKACKDGFRCFDFYSFASRLSIFSSCLDIFICTCVISNTSRLLPALRIFLWIQRKRQNIFRRPCWLRLYVAHLLIYRWRFTHFKDLSIWFWGISMLFSPSSTFHAFAWVLFSSSLSCFGLQWNKIFEALKANDSKWMNGTERNGMSKIKTTDEMNQNNLYDFVACFFYGLCVHKISYLNIYLRETPWFEKDLQYLYSHTSQLVTFWRVLHWMRFGQPDARRQHKRDWKQIGKKERKRIINTVLQQCVIADAAITCASLQKM